MGEQNPVEIVLAADAKQVATAVKQVKDALNDAERTAAAERRHVEAIHSLNKRLADLKRQERRADWEKLSIEERIAKLKERQLLTEDRLARHGENRLRRTALLLRQQQTQTELRQLQGQQPGGDLMDQLLNVAGIGWIGSRFGTARNLVGSLSKMGILRSAAVLSGTIGGGGLALAGAHSAYRQTEERALNIRDLSRRTGLGAEDTQAMMYGTGIVGLNPDIMMAAIEDLKVNVGQALNGSEELQKAFANIGISLEDLRRKNHLEILRQISDALKSGGGNAMSYADAARVMGNNFKALGPFLDDILQKMEKFKDKGMGMSEGQVGSYNANQMFWKEFYGGPTNAWQAGKAWLGAGWSGIKNRLAYSADFVSGGRIFDGEQREQLKQMIGAQGYGIDIYGARAEAERMKKLELETKARRAQEDAATAQKDSEAKAAADKAKKDADVKAAKEAEDAEAIASSGIASNAMRADALARIGLYRGGAGDHTTRVILSDQLRELRRVVDKLEQIRWQGVMED